MKETKIKLRSLLSFLMVFAVALSFAVAFAKTPVEIDIMHRWTGKLNEPLQKIIDNFKVAHPEIKVQSISVPGVYTNLETKILARMAAGEKPPSIVVPGYYLLSHSVMTFNPVPIEEAAGAEARLVFDQFLPATLELGQVDGVQWALAFALSNPILYYNPEFFKKSGLDPNDPPETWREVYLMSRIIKDKTKIDPVWIQILDTYLPQSLIESNGGYMVKEGRAAFNSPEAIEAIRMWQRFYTEKFSPKVKHQEGFEGFLAGRIAMVTTSPSLIPSFSARLPAVKTAKLPAFGCKPRRLASGGACLMITAKDPEERKAAWELMKYMVSKKGMTTWVVTGYISPLDPAKVKIPMLSPLQKPSYEQLSGAVQWTNWPGVYGLEAEKIFLDWMDKILFEGLDVEEGLNEAVRIVNDLML